MGKTEIFFEGQRAVIIKHVSEAKCYILLAMAYFTDEGLFNLLIKKVQEGVRVQLLVREDETNIISGIDYEKLNSFNAYFSYNKDIHHKFCVIDGITVLCGSYNWTNQAARLNHEDLSVISDDMDIAFRYTARFFTMKTKLSPLIIKLLDSPRQKTSNDDFKKIIEDRRGTKENNSKRMDSLRERLNKRKKKREEDNDTNTPSS